MSKYLSFKYVLLSKKLALIYAVQKIDFFAGSGGGGVVLQTMSKYLPLKYQLKRGLKANLVGASKIRPIALD